MPFGTHDVAVTDNLNATPGSSPTTASYISFHVMGLGTTILANPGADLVVSANLPSGVPSGSYIGGLSVVSAPEPSTYALMLGGLAFLAFCVRRKSASVK